MPPYRAQVLYKTTQSEPKRSHGRNNAYDPIEAFNDFIESESPDANDGGLPTVIPDDRMKITRSSRVPLEENPSVSAIVDLVYEKLLLNQKKRPVAEKVISEAISIATTLPNVTRC